MAVPIEVTPFEEFRLVRPQQDGLGKLGGSAAREHRDAGTDESREVLISVPIQVTRPNPGHPPSKVAPRTRPELTVTFTGKQDDTLLPVPDDQIQVSVAVAIRCDHVFDQGRSGDTHARMKAPRLRSDS